MIGFPSNCAFLLSAKFDISGLFVIPDHIIDHFFIGILLPQILEMTESAFLQSFIQL